MKNNRLPSSPDSGLFDPTFGTDGKIAHLFPGTTTSQATGLTLTKTGSMIVSATVYNDGKPQFGLMALQANGSIDRSFGEEGFIRNDFLPDVPAMGGPVSVLDDGKILLAGFNFFPPDRYQHVLARFKANGEADPDFGDGGQVIVELPAICATASAQKKRPPRPAMQASADEHHSLPMMVTDIHLPQVQADGKILLALHPTVTDAFGSGVLMRFNANGTPDEAFNGVGYVVVRVEGAATRLFGYRVQPDGKIIAHGTVDQRSGCGLIVRYKANGQLDESFGNDGYATVEVENRTVGIRQVAIHTSGRLVATGDVTYLDPDPTGLGSNDCLVTGLTKDGHPDFSFNRGVPVHDFPETGNSYWFAGIASINDTTTTVGAKLARGDYKSEYLVGRYSATGGLDRTFANGKGWVKFAVFGSGDAPTACVMQDDQKLLIAGNSWIAGSYRIALVRLLTKP